MTLPANDLHDAPANCELSLDDLDAVAAGSIFGRIYHFIKDAATDKVHEYEMAGRGLIDAGRTIYHIFF
jgi:hypothetical protein